MRAESTSGIDIGHYMIHRYVLIHLPSYTDKLENLLLLIRKLYSFAAGDCGVDNADSLQNQELLMEGHLILSKKVKIIMVHIFEYSNMLLRFRPFF
jgi:DNA-directed RNA polymerase I subunit RPA2